MIWSRCATRMCKLAGFELFFVHHDEALAWHAFKQTEPLATGMTNLVQDPIRTR